jgi:hypothetical protein
MPEYNHGLVAAIYEQMLSLEVRLFHVTLYS